MRPQIRSVPLDKIECPQFSWVIRNNSENVSAVLRPDLPKQYIQEKTSVCNKSNMGFSNNREENYSPVEENVRVPQKSCYCVDRRLKPTLFPHPVTCMCAEDPSYPTDEHYRYRKLDLENRRIGDIMQETYMDSMTSSPYIPKGERLVKKIMRSAFVPEDARFEDVNVGIQCPADDPICQQSPIKLTDRNTSDVGTSTSFREPNLLNNSLRGNDPLETVRDFTEEEKSEWKNDTIFCKCRLNSKCICTTSGTNKCTCKRSCLKCTSSKSEDRRDSSRKSVEFEEPTMDDMTNSSEFTKEPELLRLDVEVESLEDEEPESLESVRRYERTETTITSSPQNIRTEIAEGTDKTPVIICQRMEQCKPDITAKNSVPFYEHYRNLNVTKSRSTSKSTVKSSDPSASSHKPSGTSSSSVPIKAKRPLTRQTKLGKTSKFPWNFNNQPKVDDPMKGWGSNRYSWIKKKNYTKLVKKFQNKTKDGRDCKIIANTGKEVHPVKDNISKREEREDQRRMRDFRISNWNRDVEPSREKYGKPHEFEEHETIDAKDTIRKKKVVFHEAHAQLESSDDHWESVDAEEEEREPEKETQKKLTTIQQRYNKPYQTKINDKKLERNLRLKQSKTVILSEHPSFISNPHVFNEMPFSENHRTHVVSMVEQNTNENHGSDCYCCEEKTNRCAAFNTKYNKPLSDRSKNVFGTTARTIKRCPRPISANTFMQDDCAERPFSNMIKHKVLSRNKPKINSTEELEEFRNEHYFETHSTPAYLGDFPEHTCVHRFTIDDRLVPQPLHSDASGTSCCIHCDKPMRSEKSVFFDQRESRGKIKKESKLEKPVTRSGLRPKPIHMGAKNSVMEIKLGPEHEELLKHEDGEKWKKNFYRDSMALRHQRRFNR